MAVSYILPLQRAWLRTRDMLFHRFGLEGWAVLGFAAFLAGLVDAGLLNGWRTRWGVPLQPFDMANVSVMGISAAWFDDRWFALAAPLIAVGAVVLLTLLWVGSRGKFVFLDCAVRERPAIVEPWTRCGRQGDSLFLWRLLFWLIGFGVLGLAASPVLLFNNDNPLIVFPVLVSVFVAFCLGVVFAVVLLLLESFIVPIMYARGLTCGAAWGVLLPLLRRFPVEFVLFAVFVLIAWVLVVGVGIVVATLTCCVIWPVLLLLVVPYVRSVLLLPITVTYRLFSVEFLAQFGADYVIAPAPANGPGPQTAD